MFRDETTKTTYKANVGRHLDVYTTELKTHRMNTARQKSLELPIQGSLRLSETLLSTCYFMRQMVLPVGWFPLIPKFYQEFGQEGCFRWAVDAASLFLFGNRNGDDQLLVRARTLYGMALHATNVAISDPIESLRDETFCAILILNIIDVRIDKESSIGDGLIILQDITGDMSFVAGTHVEGCRELLVQRDTSNLVSTSASDLVLSVVIQTVSRGSRFDLNN